MALKRIPIRRSSWPHRFGLLVIVMSGCGKPTVTVSGLVTHDNETIESGIIKFLPVGDTTGPGFGGRIVQGNYRVPQKPGPRPGTYRVEIVAHRPHGDPIQLLGDADDHPLREFQPVEQYLPPKYNEESELDADITPGDNTVNFDLEGGE